MPPAMASRIAPTARKALQHIADWATPRGLALHGDARSGAVFSACGQWRYLLWRLERPRGKLLGMGLLNPSTADHRADDPTIRQCRARAAQAGAAGVLVWNLFAFRATLPADLKRAADPVGPGNDAAIALALSLCRRTILGWGTHGCYQGRDKVVLAACSAAGHRLQALGITASGQPRHPLYLRSDVIPAVFKGLDAR